MLIRLHCICIKYQVDERQLKCKWSLFVTKAMTTATDTKSSNDKFITNGFFGFRKALNLYSNKWREKDILSENQTPFITTSVRNQKIHFLLKKKLREKKQSVSLCDWLNRDFERQFVNEEEKKERRETTKNDHIKWI